MSPGCSCDKVVGLIDQLIDIFTDSDETPFRSENIYDQAILLRIRGGLNMIKAGFLVSKYNIKHVHFSSADPTAPPKCFGCNEVMAKIEKLVDHNIAEATGLINA